MGRNFGIGITLIALGGLAIWSEYAKSYPPKIKYVKKPLGNYNARTIPPLGIYIKESEKGNKELLRHEMEHWKQFKKMGLFDFYVSTLIGMMQGYDNSFIEKEARKNESEYCRNNYTECVRSGKSKTVHNSKFRT